MVGVTGSSATSFELKSFLGASGALQLQNFISDIFYFRHNHSELNLKRPLISREKGVHKGLQSAWTCLILAPQRLPVQAAFHSP